MGVKDLRMRLLVLSVTGAGIVALSPKLNQRALESAVVKVVAAVGAVPIGFGLGSLHRLLDLEHGLERETALGGGSG